MHVSAHHFQRGMPEYLLQPEYITTVVNEEISGKTMAAQMGVQPGDAGISSPSLQQMLDGIRAQRFAFDGQKETVVAWLRRRGLAASQRPSIEFQLRVPGRSEGAWDKALSAILVVTILGALGMLGYAIAAPKVGEKFTEFYILGTDGKADSYVTELHVNEVGKVVVGIVNNEYETVTYRIEVTIDGVKNNEINGLTLLNREKWENEVTITPQTVEGNYRVEFFLFKIGETTPMFEPLRLWVNVTR